MGFLAFFLRNRKDQHASHEASTSIVSKTLISFKFTLNSMHVCVCVCVCVSVRTRIQLCICFLGLEGKIYWVGQKVPSVFK